MFCVKTKVLENIKYKGIGHSKDIPYPLATSPQLALITLSVQPAASVTINLKEANRAFPLILTLAWYTHRLAGLVRS